MNDYYVLKKIQAKKFILSPQICARNFWQRKSDYIFQSRFNPLEKHFSGFFDRFCAKLNDPLFLPLKLALRVERSDTAHSPISTLFDTVRKRLTSDLLVGVLPSQKIFNATMQWRGG